MKPMQRRKEGNVSKHSAGAMKYSTKGRRPRSRGNGKRHPSSRTFESSSPDAKVRGTAQQVLDKYLNLAQDAVTAGDRVAAEGYFQHAEHYYRILHVDSGPRQGGQVQVAKPDQPQTPSGEASQPEAARLVGGNGGQEPQPLPGEGPQPAAADAAEGKSG
jgi:hypothetical protein